MTDQIEKLNLETKQLRDGLQDLGKLADGFGHSMVTAFAGAIIHGRQLSDVLRGLAQTLLQSALTAGLKPLGDLVGGLFSNVVSGAPAPAPKDAPVARATNITVNISTPDVQSFQRSQSQVSALMARAVARGQRNF